MKTLNVPHTSVSKVKSNPTEIFKQAEEEKTGVYVLNRNNVAGVMVSAEQYESLIYRIERLEEENLDLIAASRLQDTNVKTYTDEEVRGDLASGDITIDENDGWE